MRLTEEQVLLLEIEKNAKVSRFHKLQNMIVNTNASPSLVGTYRNTGEDIRSEIYECYLRLSEIDYLLEHSIRICNPNSRSIDIGSKFSVVMKYGEDDYQYQDVVLVEKKVGTESSDCFVSLESPFGRAVYHKNVGEHFRYLQENGKFARGYIATCRFEREDLGTSIVKAKHNV